MALGKLFVFAYYCQRWEVGDTKEVSRDYIKEGSPESEPGTGEQSCQPRFFLAIPRCLRPSSSPESLRYQASGRLHRPDYLLSPAQEMCVRHQISSSLCSGKHTKSTLSLSPPPSLPLATGTT